MFMKLDETCTIEQRISHDGRKPTYGTPSYPNCRYGDARKVNTDGTDIIIPAWLIVPTGTTISETSRITLEDGRQPPVKSIKNIKNFRTKQIEGIKITLGEV